jgi:hypothetical protein
MLRKQYLPIESFANSVEETPVCSTCMRTPINMLDHGRIVFVLEIMYQFVLILFLLVRPNCPLQSWTNFLSRYGCIASHIPYTDESPVFAGKACPSRDAFAYVGPL